MTIGEFAHAAGLTAKALRLYDELGLLRPAAVEQPTGYRLYEAGQLDRARLVAALRRVGMPLARIAAVAALPAPEAAADLSAWWRQVELDTADRRVGVGELLARWRGLEDGMTTQTVTTSGASGTEQGGRDVQQDEARTDGGRAVVADGFHDGGAAASRALAEAVLAAEGADPLATLRSAFAAAATAVGDTAAGGTTATALCCDGSRVAVAHLGDSRAYLMREGVLTQLTVDHSRVASLVDEGRLTPEEARAHPERQKLVRALGTDEPDVHVRTALPGDRYLLCTDGVWVPLDDAALARALAAPEPPAAVVGNLLEQVLAAGAPDNAGCAVVDLGPGEERTAPSLT